MKVISLFIGRLGVRTMVLLVRGDLEGKGRRAASSCPERKLSRQPG